MSNDNKNTFRQRLILWSNRVLFDYQFKREGYFFKLILPRKYKKPVKVLKVLLTLISLLSAFFIFQSVFIAFLFGLAVYVVSTILEKTIFTYSTLYVHPLPSFELDQDKWLAVFWGYAKDPKNNNEIPLLGLQFSEEDYARNIYNLLLSWSFGEHDDKKNNIKLSVILTDKNSYSFFCYPSTDRETASKFYKDAENEIKKESANDIQNRIAMMLILGKSFDILEGSYFPTFRKRYKNGVPYIFQIGIPGKDGAVEQVPNTKHFIFYNLKILDKSDLTRKDIEYDMVRIFQ